MAEHVLEVENLMKSYGSSNTVDGTSFAVPRGKIIGFLGPNGAGKTTTIHTLLGITQSNGGTIRYFGKDFGEYRLASLQRINTTSAFNTLQGRITVWENLLVFAELYQVDNVTQKINTLLERFEIDNLSSVLYNNLSAGQKTRVNFVKSLLNDPEIILMDEPTASLDPDIADKALSLIEELRRERNLSILYTSHNMPEITRICDEVIFLDHGKIVAHDTPLNLTRRVSSATLRLTFSDGREAVERYLREKSQQFSFLGNNIVEISSDDDRIPDLLFGVSHVGVYITDIEIHKPTLEDVFLQIARK